ncbi:MAG: heme-binding protein, partial [Burkholderiales bacterium]|nr:heme-binding protein [Opitutaceae bacterium]
MAPLRLLTLALGLLACTARVLAITPAINSPAYTAADLDRIQQQAADLAMESFPRSVIAIVDRDGRELLLRRADGTGGITADERAIAVAKAGTAVFLSSNEQSFTPRTASFIIQQNFPPRIRNRPPGPLVGVGFSNLAYSDINYFREADGVTRIPGTRLRASPGGVPLYKNGRLFAGIGVTGDGTEAEFTTDPGYDRVLGSDPDEAAALAGQIGYAPHAKIHGSGVLLDGIRVPYVKTPVRRAKVAGL